MNIKHIIKISTFATFQQPYSILSGNFALNLVCFNLVLFQFYLILILFKIYLKKRYLKF